jgi:hypothetical protein
MELDIETFKREAANRLINHVFPLFDMNLQGQGFTDEQIKGIFDALLDAYREDTEILKAAAPKKS